MDEIRLCRCIGSRRVVPAQKNLLAGVCCFLLQLLWVPQAAFAGASADSQGSDWWGDNSGWVWNWPGIARAPGGTIRGEYKHWFEGAEPKAWSGHGPAIWTLPATIGGFPYWPSSIDGDTKGKGAFSTDTHTDQASSDWRWEAFRNPLFPSSAVLRKGTSAYANAKSIPYVKTEAHSRTRLDDPWVFETPGADEQWSVLGRVAPRANLSAVNVGKESGAAFFDLSYQLSIDGADVLDMLRLYVGVGNELSPVVTLESAAGLHFYRDGSEISKGLIESELMAFMLSADRWVLDGETGRDLDAGYYFDVVYNMPASSANAVLYSVMLAGADDAHYVASPGVGLLMLFSMPVLWRCRAVQRKYAATNRLRTLLAREG